MAVVMMMEDMKPNLKPELLHTKTRHPGVEITTPGG
jgi:hypothetical protein